MSDDSRKIPTHELTYGRLRDLILFGELAPGQPVTIQGLTADLAVGMTPVREAIRRLAAEGALLPQGNRRVTVPRMTRGDLEQVAFARLAVEPRLAELAAKAVTPDLIAQLHDLDARVDVAIAAGNVHDYLESNHAFHFALYEAAGAGILLDMARSLWLRFGPSLRVVMAHAGAADLPDSHKEMLTALQAGDAAAVAAAMQRDIEQGIEHVQAGLQRGEI